MKTIKYKRAIFDNGVLRNITPDYSFECSCRRNRVTYSDSVFNYHYKNADQETTLVCKTCAKGARLQAVGSVDSLDFNTSELEEVK